MADRAIFLVEGCGMDAALTSPARTYAPAWLLASSPPGPGAVTRAAGDGPPPGPRVYTFRASSEAENRLGEIDTNDGWETTAYLRNPVVLLAHAYSALPIGRVIDLRHDQGLIVDIVFDAEDPLAQAVQRKLDNGFLNAVSVGFRALEVQQPADGRGPLRHTRKELLEISVVAVPANPDALLQRALGPALAALALADGAATPATLERTARLLDDLAARMADSPPAPARSPAPAPTLAPVPALPDPVAPLPIAADVWQRLTQFARGGPA